MENRLLFETILSGLAVGFILYWFYRTTRKRRPTAKFAGVYSSGIKLIGDLKKMEMKEGQKAILEVEVFTAAGHPAAIESGSARWTSSDESVISVVQDPDNEKRATIRGLDGSANESVVIEFRADGDRDQDEVKPIVATLAVTCTQGDAIVATILATNPVDDVQEPQPEPAPEPPTMPAPADPTPETETDPIEPTPAEPVEGDPVEGDPAPPEPVEDPGN